MALENAEWFAWFKVGGMNRCPKCQVVTSDTEWTDCEPYCEDCGSHVGIKCPSCGYWFDHVFESDASAGG